MDLELIKMVINGGSFACIVVILFHTLFKTNPQQSKAMQDMATQHSEAMLSSQKANQDALTMIVKEFKEALLENQKECTKERAQLLKRADENSDKDRDLRHRQGNLIMACVGELREEVRALNNTQPKQGD